MARPRVRRHLARLDPAARRAERPGREPRVHVGRHPGALERRAALEPDLHRAVRRAGPRRHVAAPVQDAIRPIHPRRHAEPRDGLVRRRADGARGYLGVRPRLRHRRPRRLRALAARQRRPGSRPGLHRRLVPGGGVRRRRPARRHRVCRARPRLRQQAARVLVGRGAREDRGAGLHHPLHPAPAAGPLCAARPGGRLSRLYGARGWTILGAGAFIAFALFPVLNLAVPAGHPLHLSNFWVTLGGKIMCYAIVAVALDLVWGYAGILSLGHGLFFALGGYAMGMYLMRQIGREGQYQSDLPDFMVFLDWKAFPWFWTGSEHFLWSATLVILVPGLLAFVFGYFAFRSRVKGVYFSIITQALTFAAMLAFFRNAMGFGGNNGFTDFKRVLGFAVAAPRTRTTLYVLSGLYLLATLLLARWVVTSKFGRVLSAIRDAEQRVMFCGYDPVHYKVAVFTASAVLCGIAGALYVPQVGIINPSEMSPANSIEIAIWVAVGGRGTLAGAIVGAGIVNGAKSFFTQAFPEFWLYFLGLLFILVTLFLPQGVIGALGQIRDRLRVRKLDRMQPGKA